MDQITNIPRLDTPFPVEDPQLIPSRRYYDEAFFRAEAEHLWPHVWQMACRLEEIPEIGDYVEYKILSQSVIVVRTKSGVKAFHNACRHRGVRLVGGQGNCKTSGFICPFHGWRWNMDGENTFVFGRQIFDEAVLAQADIKLVPCRVELWGGCAFINFDDEAPALLGCIAPVAKVMDVRNVENMRVEWWSSTILPTNWKLAMEAFMEGYHVMRTHPQLHEVTIPGGHEPYAEQHDSSPAPKRSMTGQEAVEVTVEHFRRLCDGMGGMIHANDVAVAAEVAAAMELPDEPRAAMGAWMRRVNEEITSRARAQGIPMPDLSEIMVTNPAAPVQYVFPHYFMLPMFGNMSSYRIRPLTPETCLFELWSLTLYPDNVTGERPVPPVPVAHDSAEFPAIPQQDYSNLPLQQLGLHAKGFDHMRLSAKVEGLISNYQRLIDGYLQGVEQEKLLTAMQLVCGPYDSPIHDLGI